MFALWSILCQVWVQIRGWNCCSKILADDQDLDSFHICLKKNLHTDKRSEAIREPTLFFLDGAVWFQRMGFPSWIQSVWSRSWILSSPRSCLWLRQHTMMKRVEQKVFNWTTEMVTDKPVPRGPWGPHRGEGQSELSIQKKNVLTELHT